jgi:hypothetical protein
MILAYPAFAGAFVLSLVMPALLVPNSALAAWPTKSGVNLPICTESGPQQWPDIVGDGAGGAIVTWEDHRGADWDVYAQHVLPTGVADPAWPVVGRSLCPATGDQRDPKIVTDGHGGAIITWVDHRGDCWHVYAQHLLATGVMDSAWPSAGRAVCSADSNQIRPRMVGDGAGGAIVAWLDSRAGARQKEIVAQHLLASGALDPAWPADAVVVCGVGASPSGDREMWVEAFILEQVTLAMVGDASGGVIVVWDAKQDSSWDVRAHHVLSNGQLDHAWPTGGRILCASAAAQRRPVIITDGAHGAIVAWEEKRGDANGVYAQHLQASGARDPAWPSEGRLVSTPRATAVVAALVADGTGGALVTWGGDLHAVQHLLPTGTVDSAWPKEGCHLSDYFGDGFFKLVADGAGGAIVVWSRELDGFHFSLKEGRYMTHEGDIYAQHVLARGVVDPSWPQRGLAVSTAKGRQYSPVAVEDGAGGAIFVWEDWRAGDLVGGTHWGDIFAQRVQSNGKLGGAVTTTP